jgi:hypothetical protein
VKKSPNEKTNLTIPYPIKYGRSNGNSIWIEKEIVDMLYAWEFISRKGAWINISEEFRQLVLDETGIIVPEKIQGADNLFLFIENDSKLAGFLIGYFKRLINNEI